MRCDQMPSLHDWLISGRPIARANLPPDDGTGTKI
jgi:hypothetical protein